MALGNSHCDDVLIIWDHSHDLVFWCHHLWTKDCRWDLSAVQAVLSLLCSEDCYAASELNRQCITFIVGFCLDLIHRR